MAILFTAALLLGCSAALALLRVLRPRFRFSWLVAFAITSAAWLSVFLWLPQLPVSLAIPLWKSAFSPGSFATFEVGSQTWIYAMCLVTLALAVLLTAPARSGFPSPSKWALCLAITGLGLLTVAAGSPLTLVLFWAGLDLTEAGIVLARSGNRSSSGQVAFAFTARLGSMALVLLALVLGETEDLTGFAAILGPASVLLPAAALLRLTAFAIPWPRNLSATGLGLDEVGTTLHLAAGASALAFLSQLAPEAPDNSGALLLLCAAAGLFAGWMWLRAPDAYSGRPLWIMGTGCLAVAAALRGNPTGSAALGSLMLLAGTSLFLTVVQERWTNRALYAALWMGSALPFTMTATAWLGSGATDWTWPVLLISHAMVLAGFFNQALRPETTPGKQIHTASLRGVYQVGIVMPLVLGVLLGIWGWPGAFQLGIPIPGVVVICIAAALVWAKRRLPVLNPISSDWIPGRWQRAATVIQQEATRFHGGLQRGAEAVTRTIEGEAGIMWSLLLLVLFVSVIVSGER